MVQPTDRLTGTWKDSGLGPRLSNSAKPMFLWARWQRCWAGKEAVAPQQCWASLATNSHTIETPTKLAGSPPLKKKKNTSGHGRLPGGEHLRSACLSCAMLPELFVTTTTKISEWMLSSLESAKGSCILCVSHTSKSLFPPFFLLY